MKKRRDGFVVAHYFQKMYLILACFLIDPADGKIKSEKGKA